MLDQQTMAVLQFFYRKKNGISELRTKSVSDGIIINAKVTFCMIQILYCEINDVTCIYSPFLSTNTSRTDSCFLRITICFKLQIANTTTTSLFQRQKQPVVMFRSCAHNE